MKVSRGLPKPPLPPHPVLTIGNFDGQHLGHRYLLSTVVNCARERGGTPMVLTFDPHPVQVLNPKADFQFLTAPEEKLTWFESVGVEHLVILEFTKSFAALSPEEFVQSILCDGLGVCDLFVGEHFERVVMHAPIPVHAPWLADRLVSAQEGVKRLRMRPPRSRVGLPTPLA